MMGYESRRIGGIEMSLFAVKNDEGGWLEYDGPIRADWNTSNGTLWAKQNKHYAEVSAKRLRGHVVELVEAPAKIVVSEDEAEMLKQAKDTTVWRPALVIAGYAYDNTKDSDDETLLEDRLMHAYVIGWTIEKPKRYVLPMPYGADYDDPDDSHYAVVNREYHAGPAWYQGPCVSFKEAREHYTVTQSDIDAAPDWVKAIKPVEVTDNEQQ